MSFFSKLFGKPRPAAITPFPAQPLPYSTEPRETRPELRSAIEALQAGKTIRAIAYARGSGLLDSPDLQARADAHRVIALACSHENNYRQAAPHWRALCALEEDGNNWLNLASSLAILGELDEGDAAFERARQLAGEGKNSGQPLPFIHANYLTALERGGHPERALVHLEWLRGLYQEIKVTDGHFLYTRGVPFIESLFEKSVPIVMSQMPLAEARAWYLGMRDDLDDDGKARLDAHVAELG